MGTPPTQEEAKKQLLVGVASVVVVVGLALGLKLAFSPGEGEACKDSAWGCNVGMRCVRDGAKYVCRKTCKDDGDCASGKRCRSLIVIGGKGPEKACLE